jgi:hypothetical protein
MIDRNPLFVAYHLEDVPGWHASQRVKPIFRQMKPMSRRDDLPRPPMQRHGVSQCAVTIENNSLNHGLNKVRNSKPEIRINSET